MSQLMYHHPNVLAAMKPAILLLSLKEPCPGTAPAAWSVQTEVLEDTVVLIMPQSSLCLWDVSVVPSKVQLIPSLGLPEAAAPSLQQCWHFPQQETWRLGNRFANNKTLKAIRKASCMENQTGQAKQRLPST